MNTQAQDVYAKTQVATASPGDLTLMLFNGYLKFAKQALNGMQLRQYEQKNYNIKRAQDIIDELLCTLNMQYEISRNLSALYHFISEKMVEANVKMNQQSLHDCIELMTELRDAWAEALKKVKRNGKLTG
ncbi:MAG TPA: flagellar export chaperone FliS [Bacilli bacterium]